MKVRKNYRKILCSAAFCLALSLAGCGGSSGSTSGSSGESGSGSSSQVIPTGSYEVKFETRGGTKIDSQVVKSGEKATKPSTDPTRTGFVFVNWFWDFDAQTPFDFESPITSATTVYAGWKLDYDTLVPGGGGGGGGGGGTETTAQVTFQVTVDAGFGNRIYFAGSFNNWEVSNDYKMDNGGSGNIWTGTFTLPTGPLEFKFVKSGYDGPSSYKGWESDPNHQITVTSGMPTQVITWQ